MALRMLVTIACLMVFLVEVTLDPSTSFVRSTVDPCLGKLVVVVDEAGLPGPLAGDSGAGEKNRDLSPGSASSMHAGTDESPRALRFVPAPVSVLALTDEGKYLSPWLQEIQRPPRA